MIIVEKVTPPIPWKLILALGAAVTLSLFGFVALLIWALPALRPILAWAYWAAPIFGAVTVAAQASPTGFIRSSMTIFNVTATADADTTATIPHTLVVVPEEVYIHPIDPAARISLWVETIGSRDGTNIVLTKATGVGSGAAPAQIRVSIKKPHTLVR